MPSTRLEYLDLLRCLSILGVCIMHSAAPLLFNPEATILASGLAYSALCLYCVPTLLMISGALMLGDNRPLSLGAFYGKRLMKILVPLLVWSFIYYLIICMQAHDFPNLLTFLKRFFTGLWSGPLWFLYMIVGVYLMSPFLRSAFANRDNGLGVAFVVLTFGLCAVNLSTRLIWGLDLNRFLTGSVIPYYFGYFVLGHLLNTANPRIPGGKPVLALVFLMSAGLSMLGEFAARFNESMLPNSFFNYQQPLTALMAASLFLFFKGWKTGEGSKTGRFIRELSGLSYGIFLSHVLVLTILTGQIGLVFKPGNGLDWFTITPWIGPLLTGVATFTVSALLTAALKRLPLLNRIVP